MTVLWQAVGQEGDLLTKGFASGVQQCFLLASVSWAL